MRWLSRAQALMAAALCWGLPDASAAGEQPGNFDQRLLFDPGALAQSRFLDSADQPSSRRPDAAAGENSRVAVRGADGLNVPELGIDPLAVDIPRIVDRPVPSNPIATGLRPDANRLDPHVSLGNFSLGFETDTPVNPRIPFAGDMNETGYDTSYDPKHPHPLPFFGLSAKSILP